MLHFLNNYTTWKHCYDIDLREMAAPLWHFQFGGISELIRILIGFINQLIYILDRSIQNYWMCQDENAGNGGFK